MKWFLRILILLIVVALAVIVFFPGPFVKPVATKVATDTLGVEVTMDKLMASLVSGSVGLENLEVDNPQGYDKEFLVRIGDLDVKARLTTFMSAVAQIPYIGITGLHLNIENKGGKTNISTLLDNLSKGSAPDPEKPEEKQSEGKKFRIEKIVLKDTKIVLAPGIGTDISLSVAEFEMNNIGTDKEGGANLSEVFSAMLKGLAAKAMDLSKDLSGELQKALKDGGMLDNLGSSIKEGTGDLIEGVKKPFNNIFK